MKKIADKIFYLALRQGLDHIFITVLVLCLTIQALFFVSVIASFFPLIITNDLVIPDQLKPLFRPERETLFWALAVVGAGVLMALACRFYQKHGEDVSLRRRFFYYACGEFLLTVLLIAAKYKAIIFDYRAQLATTAFYALLLMAIGYKIFFPAILHFLCRLWALVMDPKNQGFLQMIFTLGMVIFIGALVWIPDMVACLAKAFIGEQFHHLDHFIMAPGFAFVKGNIPYIDNLSEYGVGIPVVLTGLASWFGAFSYETIYQTVVSISTAYYIVYFLFLRQLLSSSVLAAAAVLLGMKFQMFYTMSYPLVFTYPSSTAVRHFFDVIVWVCIYQHAIFLQRRYLMLASVVCGAAMFYMTATGVCVFVALAAYVFLLALRRQITLLTGAMVLGLSLIVWIGLYVMILGKNIVNPVFWQNMQDFMNLFTSGFIMGPFWTGLAVRQFIDVAMAFVIPITYVLTVLVIGSQYYLKQYLLKDVVVLVLAIYGLGVFHHHVAMSMANNYYTMAWPFVTVVAFWFKRWLVPMTIGWQRGSKLAALIVCFYALVTNHHFTSYPNVFNFSKNPMVDPMVAQPLPDRIPYFHHIFTRYSERDKVAFNNLGNKDEGLLIEADFRSDSQLKDYYYKEFDFSKDAALIRRYTAVNDKVALISSFEVKMLMQADRAPFIYFFPLLDTKPMRGRVFGIANIFTKDHLAQIIGDFEKHQPPYVFLEKIFLTADVPPHYEKELYGLMDILRYVKTHYNVIDEGQYLVAMKRKDTP